MKRYARNTNSLGTSEDFVLNNQNLIKPNLNNNLNKKQEVVTKKTLPSIDEQYESLQEIKKIPQRVQPAVRYSQQHQLYQQQQQQQLKHQKIVEKKLIIENKKQVNNQDKENSQINNQNRINELHKQVQNIDQIIKQTQDMKEIKQEKEKGKIQIDQKKILNDILVQNYGKQIYMNLRDKKEERVDFLKNHEVSGKIRAKMVDWMIEVLSSYKCQDQSLFKAVQLMDRFYEKSTNVQKANELHLTGVVAMWMASKYEEIYPLRLQVLEQKIAHNKLTKQEIKQKETEIISTIQFQMGGITIYEQIHLLVQNLNIQVHLLTNDNLDYFNKVISYLSKMVLYDYNLLLNVNIQYLSTATLFVAFKIIEQIIPTFPTQIITTNLINYTQQNDSKLYDIAQKVLNLAKNFDTLFPNLENLKKFNGFQLDEKQQKQ